MKINHRAKLINYTAICNENGDQSPMFFKEKDARRWACNYEYGCYNQDKPWHPTFRIVSEVLEEE